MPKDTGAVVAGMTKVQNSRPCGKESKVILQMIMSQSKRAAFRPHFVIGPLHRILSCPYFGIVGPVSFRVLSES